MAPPSPYESSLSSSSRTVDLRCLSMCAEPEHVPVTKEDAHVLNPKRVDIDFRVRCMEWAWGVEDGALDVSKELNQAPMRQDMLRSLRELGWCLLPTNEVLERAVEWSQQQCGDGSETEVVPVGRRHFIDDFPAGEYEYVFYPCESFSAQDNIPLYIHNSSTSTASAHIEEHAYPYTSLPHFTSTVHPFFVIEHAACTPLSWREGLLPPNSDTFVYLQLISELWGELPVHHFLPGGGKDFGMGMDVDSIVDLMEKEFMWFDGDGHFVPPVYTTKPKTKMQEGDKKEDADVDMMMDGVRNADDGEPTMLVRKLEDLQLKEDKDWTRLKVDVKSKKLYINSNLVDTTVAPAL